MTAVPDQPGPPLPGGRRRSHQRRRALAASASRHIIEHGFEGFSVNTLAEDVGMSVGGMYRYIKTKSDLLVMACEDIYGGLREELAELTTGELPLPDKLRAAVETYFRSCLGNRDQILLMYREYRHLPREAQLRYMQREKGVAGVFADAIAAGQRRAVFAAGPSPLVLAEDIILLGHLPALKSWALRDEVAAEEVVRQHTDLIMTRLMPMS